MPGAVEPEPAAAAAAAAAGDTPPIELPIDDTPPRPYVVFNQNVDIEIDFAQRRVHGRSDILICPTADVSEVFIDARQCDIDVSQITVSNCEVEASYQDPCEWADTPDNYEWSASQWGIRKHRMEPLLHHRRKEVSALDHDLKCCTPLNGSIKVKLPSVDEVVQKNRNAQRSDQQDVLLNSDGTVGGYRIRIPFKLKKHSDGLHFVGCDEADTRYAHVYTRHSVEPGTASAIFPCIDDPGSEIPGSSLSPSLGRSVMPSTSRLQRNSSRLRALTLRTKVAKGSTARRSLGETKSFSWKTTRCWR